MKTISYMVAAFATLVVPLQPAFSAPLERFNNRLFLTTTVNGQRAQALLDSAAEMTVIDDDFAARVGLSASGSAIAHGSGAKTLEAYFADRVAIQAAGVGFEARVGILDLGEVSQRLLGRPVDMLLGRDLFENARLLVDIDRCSIDHVDTPPRGKHLPIADYRGVPAIPASIEGRQPVQAVFDLGNGGDVLIGRAYAEKIGLAAPQRIVARRSGGGLGGARERDVVVLRSLVVAGHEFRHVPAAIDPGETASDLNIGTSILRHFIITTDFAAKSIWLDFRPLPNTPTATCS